MEVTLTQILRSNWNVGPYHRMALKGPGTRLVADITLVTKGQVKYPLRATNTKVKSYFSTNPISKMSTPKKHDPWRWDLWEIFEQIHKQWKIYTNILFFQERVDSFHHSPHANGVNHACVPKEPYVLTVHCKHSLTSTFLHSSVYWNSEII